MRQASDRPARVARRSGQSQSGRPRRDPAAGLAGSAEEGARPWQAVAVRRGSRVSWTSARFGARARRPKKLAGILGTFGFFARHSDLFPGVAHPRGAGASWDSF